MDRLRQLQVRQRQPTPEGSYALVLSGQQVDATNLLLAVVHMQTMIKGGNLNDVLETLSRMINVELTAMQGMVVNWTGMLTAAKIENPLHTIQQVAITAFSEVRSHADLGRVLQAMEARIQAYAPSVDTDGYTTALSNIIDNVNNMTGKLNAMTLIEKNRAEAARLMPANTAAAENAEMINVTTPLLVQLNQNMARCTDVQMGDQGAAIAAPPVAAPPVAAPMVAPVAAPGPTGDEDNAQSIQRVTADYEGRLAALTATAQGKINDLQMQNAQLTADNAQILAEKAQLVTEKAQLMAENAQLSTDTQNAIAALNDEVLNLRNAHEKVKKQNQKLMAENGKLRANQISEQEGDVSVGPGASMLLSARPGA